MAEFPALPLFTDAYLADTRHLSTEQHGAYLLLLMEAWRRPNTNLPDDDVLLAKLAGLSGIAFADAKSVIMQFWDLDARTKTWSQKRLTEQKKYVRNATEKQRSNAKARWNKEKPASHGNAKDDAKPMPDGCHTGNAPIPIPIPIDKEEGTNVPSSTPLSEPLDAATVKAVITAWNNLASETGIAQVQHLTENRRKALKPRLKEIGGLEGWYAMCDKIRASSFLTGQGEKPWYCTFDWVLKPANLAKIMEGNYDDRQNGSGVKKGTIARNFEAIDDAIDQLRRREDAERIARG